MCCRSWCRNWQGTNPRDVVAMPLGLDLEDSVAVLFIEESDAFYQTGKAFGVPCWLLVLHCEDFVPG